MNEKNNDTLSKLYLIRAVMSKISENKDKIEQLKREKNQCEANMRNTKCPIDYRNVERDPTIIKKIEELKRIRSQLDEFRQSEHMRDKNIRQNDILNKLSQLRAQKKELEYKNPRTVPIYTIAKLIIFTCSLLLGCTVISAILWSLWQSTQAVQYDIAFIIFTVISIIVNIVMFIINFKKVLKYKKALSIINKLEAINKEKALLDKESRNISREITYLEHPYFEQIIKIEKEINNIKDRLSQEIELNAVKKRDELKTIGKKRIEEIPIEIDNLKETSLSLYNSLKEETKSAIDERDWQYLDILIYQLETGRADSMKEALQQTDLYLRHNEIKEMVRTATVAIGSTIKQSITELSDSMRVQLYDLQSNISESITDSQHGLNRSLGQLVEAQEISNALLKKANTSSEQLVRDVNRMRELKDIEYYKS